MIILLRYTMLVLALLRTHSVMAFEEIDDFLVATQVTSPGDFSPGGSRIKSARSSDIGQYEAERTVWIHNNTIGFPEATIDIGVTADSQLTISMDQVGVEQSAGWMRLGVSYSFPEPQDVLADRTSSNAILINFLQIAGNRPPPPMTVWVGPYQNKIAGIQLQQLAILHDGPFTVAFDIDDFVDRRGFVPSPDVFDSINGLGISFLHNFDGDSLGNWRVAIGNINTGLLNTVPEPSATTALLLGLFFFCQLRTAEIRRVRIVS